MSDGRLAAYEELLQTLRGRRSVRRFAPGDVPDPLVERLCEAARWAPSAGNRQAWRLLAVRDPAALREMAEATRTAGAALAAGLSESRRAGFEGYLENFTFFETAPLVLAQIYRDTDLLALAGAARGEGRGRADALASAAAAVQNLLLAAHCLGLGACWMTGPLIAEDECARILRVPAGWALSALIPVGWPASPPAAPPRRAVARILVDGARAAGRERTPAAPSADAGEE